MSDAKPDLVRISGVIEIPVDTLVSQEQYELWEAKDPEGHLQVTDLIAMAAQEALYGADAAGLRLTKATLVEDDDYLGTDITVLKKF